MFFRHQAAKHILQIISHALQSRPGKHAHHGPRAVLHIDFDKFFFQLPGRQTLPAPIAAGLIFWLVVRRFFPGALFGRVEEFSQRGRRLFLFGNENVQDTFLCQYAGFLPDLRHPPLPYHAHRRICQIPYDGFHVPAHIAHFGKFRCLYFDEGSLHQLRQTAGNLSFSHAGGADHQNVFRNDFFPQRLV